MRFAKPIRLAPEAYENSDNTFHFVVRTHPEVGVLPQIVRDAIWQSLINEIDRPEVVLLAVVLMPDHVHLVASPGDGSLVDRIARWKSLSTRATWAAGHRGTVWQRRFYDRALRSQEELDVVVQYVLDNPVTAGFVDDQSAWAHSWVRGNGKGPELALGAWRLAGTSPATTGAV